MTTHCVVCADRELLSSVQIGCVASGRVLLFIKVLLLLRVQGKTLPADCKIGIQRGRVFRFWGSFCLSYDYMVFGDAYIVWMW